MRTYTCDELILETPNTNRTNYANMSDAAHTLFKPGERIKLNIKYPGVFSPMTKELYARLEAIEVQSEIDRGTYKILTFSTGDVSFNDNVRPKIRKIIFNPPATVILWNDGTKTVVKCEDRDVYDPYFGFMAAYMKHEFGTNSAIKKFMKNNSNYNDLVKENVEQEAPSSPEDTGIKLEEAIDRLLTIVEFKPKKEDKE